MKKWLPLFFAVLTVFVCLWFFSDERRRLVINPGGSISYGSFLGVSIGDTYESVQKTMDEKKGISTIDYLDCGESLFQEGQWCLMYRDAPYLGVIKFVGLESGVTNIEWWYDFWFIII